MGDVSPIGPGMLLVATAELLDPNFTDTVVLLLDVDDHGAMGVVINRPSPVPVAEVLSSWADSVTDPDVLFLGGPVGTDGALAVVLTETPDAITVGFRTVLGRLGILDLDTPLELVAGSLERMRVFAGYAGWGPGQLEREVAEGSWYVVPGLAADAFGHDPGQLRREVLRRQPGQLAWHANRPADPDLN